MKIIFFGSDDFALAHLEGLLAGAKHEVTALVTQPDKPRDRGMKMQASPLKLKALDSGMEVLQPENIKDESLLSSLRAIGADIFVVVSYGRFLTPEILAIPKFGAINVHASLLPKYRGAAPINWAIINGEKDTGLTIFQLNPRMDAGDIIAQIKIPIHEFDTAESLREKMKTSGKFFLESTLDTIAKGEWKKAAQSETESSYAPKLTREIGRVDWTKPAMEIERLVRGLYPYPAAYTVYNGGMLKILSVEVIDQNVPGAVPGQVVLVDKHSFFIQTGNACLKILRLQPASGKPMDTASFLRGHSLPNNVF